VFYRLRLDMKQGQGLASGMIKTLLKWASLLMLLSIPVPLHALQAGNASSLIQGLAPLSDEMVDADAALLQAGSARSGQMPGLKAALAAAASEENDIRNNHNNQHPEGSSELQKWNSLYIAAVKRKNSIAAQIQKMDQAYADAQKRKQAVVLKRQELVHAILSAFIQSHNTCAQTLTINASDEALAACGRVDFDGADPNLPPLDPSQIRRDTYFKGSVSSGGAVFDDSTPEQRAHKQRRIDAMVKASSASDTATVTTVVPPVPGAPAPEPSLSDRLKELLRNLGKR
jgi:hypothetical protein